MTETFTCRTCNLLYNNYIQWRHRVSPQRGAHEPLLPPSPHRRRAPIRPKPPVPRPRPAGVLRTSRRPSATPVPATPSPSPAPNAHFVHVLTLSDDCLPTPSAGGCRFTTPRLASQSRIAAQLIGAALEQCSCRPLPRRDDPWWLCLGRRAALHGSLERLAETNAHRRVAPVDCRQPCARIRTIATAFRTSSTFLPASRD